MLDANSTAQIITQGFFEFSYAAFVILGLVITIGVGLLVFYTGLKWLFGGAGGVGTTSRFSMGVHKFWPAGAALYDHMTYKPYKGYNRLRSRKWNMDHMPGGM